MLSVTALTALALALTKLHKVMKNLATEYTKLSSAHYY
jgi:hypothetical protein